MRRAQNLSTILVQQIGPTGGCVLVRHVVGGKHSCRLPAAGRISGPCDNRLAAVASAWTLEGTFKLWVCSHGTSF